MKEGVFIKIYCVLKDGDTVILTQDQEGRPGWKFPGGHVELGELLFTAVTREIKEEIGLDIHLENVLLIEDFFNRKRPDEHNMRFFVIATVAGGTERTKPDEVKALKRFTRSELRTLKQEEVYPQHWDALQAYLKGQAYPLSLLKEVDA
ncbi:MAG: NUDIX hydrolase [Candidatus Yanofskybacteria bacterium]|nr:NUDIX hydrolase [Candidatus Yanofskybacteria bacterium]